MKILTCLVLLSMSFIASAQSKEEVENAVKDYIDAFYYGDTAKVHNSISPDLIKHGFYRGKGKDTYLRDTMSFQQCIDYAASVKKRGPSPNVEKFPRKIDVFDVLDKTASAKVTAWWGTDYILLSRINNKWMITHVLWQSPGRGE